MEKLRPGGVLSPCGRVRRNWYAGVIGVPTASLSGHLALERLESRMFLCGLCSYNIIIVRCSSG